MGDRSRIGLASAVALSGAAVVSATAVTGAPATSIAVLAALAVAACVIAWVATPRPSTDPALGHALERLEERIGAAGRQRHEMRLRAETAGRFREEFVAEVRHELKTPLLAIVGFTQVLRDEIDGPLTEQQREDVSAIRQAGEYLTELVETVLEDWVPDRATPLPLSRVDLPVLLREVGRLLEGQKIGKPVQIVVDAAPETPRPLGDSRRLRQVLINLGTNALRATPEGSVTLRAAADEDGVRISVRDTGPGIGAEQLPHLFEEFSTAASAGGSGLGLALARDLVEWHAGRIEVETAEGEGTSFHVILPLEPR